MKLNAETVRLIEQPEIKDLSINNEVILGSNYTIWIMLAIYGATFFRRSLPNIQPKKEPELRDLYSQLALLVNDSEDIKKIRSRIEKLRAEEKKDFLIKEIVSARAKAKIRANQQALLNHEILERKQWTEGKFDGNRNDV
jgi:predicted methyltransferase MtxX (methanogen marker protein 4)